MRRSTGFVRFYDSKLMSLAAHLPYRFPFAIRFSALSINIRSFFDSKMTFSLGSILKIILKRVGLSPYIVKNPDTRKIEIDEKLISCVSFNIKSEPTPISIERALKI